MFKRVIRVVLRLLATIGFIASSMIFAVPGFEFNGRQGYEAGVPSGFLLGALTGFGASGLRLFSRRKHIDSHGRKA